MSQQPTSATHRLQQLQQQPIVQLTQLPQHQPRPTSSQSTAGPLAGERPPSRALSVVDTAEGHPQSTPPQVSPLQQQQMPAHTVPPTSAKVGTPQVSPQQISQNSGLHLSQLSAPLFTEGRCSTSTDDDQEAFDSEVNDIMRTRTPSQATTLVMTPQKLTSTPAMVDYSTQGDPDQEPPQNNDYMSQNSKLQDTNNFFIPDASDRCIHNLHNKHFSQVYSRMDTMLI